MKLLISAIACDPSGGSEGGVGWNAVKLIAQQHDVRVLVHSQFESSWQLAKENGTLPDNIRARFLCISKPWHPNRFVGRLQSWIRFMDFNRHVLRAAQAWHEEERFDLAHHITYATWRVPSPLWRLPVPFIWGPIGGAAHFPNRFLPMLSTSAKFFEIARKFNSALAARSTAFRDCIKNSAMVIAANEETETFLRPFRGGKPMLRIPVAYLTEEKIQSFRRPADHARKPGPLRLFAGGNMIGSKGLSLAVRALKRVKDSGIPFHYTIAGGGPEIPKISGMIHELGLQNEVTLHPGFQGKNYIEALWDSDVFFLPSLREALGLTMVEAILAGCYPIVADASAPGELVRIAGGTAVKADTPKEMVIGLTEAVIKASVWSDEPGGQIMPNIPLLAKALAIDNYHTKLNQAYRSCLQSPHGDPSFLMED